MRVPYAIAMREPVSEGKVSLEAHAKDVMKKGGVDARAAARRNGANARVPSAACAASPSESTRNRTPTAVQNLKILYTVYCTTVVI
jgi:hypothetical protein